MAALDNAPLVTTFVSASQITAAVPASQLQQVGSATISANNVGGLSSAPFTIFTQNALISISQTTPLTFASVPIGIPAVSLSATLSAGGNLPLLLGAISITGTNPGDFSLAPSSTCPLTGGTLQPPSSCTITVGFTPLAAGGRSAQVTIPSNSTPNPDTIALVGTATASTSPNNSFSPGLLTFANQQVGTTSLPQTITVTNTGSAPLTFSGISIASPGGFSQTNTCTAALAPAATCTITVLFSPSATGSLSNAIVVNDSAPQTAGPQSIPLTGTGTNLSVAPASGGSSSASVTSGQPATYSLQALPSGFSGTLSLSVNCSSVTGSTCAVSPSSMAINPAAPSPFSVSVTTTTNSLIPAPTGLFSQRNNQPNLLWIVLSGLAALLFLMLRMCSPRQAHRDAVPAKTAACAAGLLLFAMLVGCATGGSKGTTTAASTTGPVSTGQGTPSGTYTVVVTAQGQGIVQTLNLTLVVN